MLNITSPDVNPDSWMAADQGRKNRAHVSLRMLALLLLAVPVAAQPPGVQAQAARDSGTVDLDLASSGDAGIDARIEARRIAALNQQRQKQMISDAEKLLKLAEELNADADAGGTMLSTAERLQKTAEIEKLAKSVKDRMTYAIGLPEEPTGPYAAWQR